MKTLKSHIQGKLLGCGSTGSAYLKGDRVIKYIDGGSNEEPVYPSIRAKDIEVIDKWSKVKKRIKSYPLYL